MHRILPSSHTNSTYKKCRAEYVLSFERSQQVLHNSECRSRDEEAGLADW